jgi:hypothetical protein
MKAFLHDVAERIKNMRRGRTSTEYEIVWDPKGVRVQWLTVESKQGSVWFLWNSVSAIETFKRDFFSIDCICLAFETSEGWIEINEDMKGWHEFLRVVENRYAGFPELPSWYRKVMLPPFKANHTRLWGAPSATQNQPMKPTPQ